jgi:hypothetical protein
LIRPVDGHTIAVRYHSTDVVTFRPDGTIVLDSGGYQTVTTKQRINNYTRAHVWQDKGIWYVGGSWRDREARTLYYDGMELDREGAPVSPKRPDGIEGIKRELDRRVARYLKGYAKALADGKIGDPGPGDCFGCLFVPTGQGNDPRAQAFGLDHVLQHLSEGYYVPSLLWRAMQRRGNPAFCWQMMRGTIAQGRPVGHWLTDLRYYFRTLKPSLVALIEARGWPAFDTREG